MKISVVTVSHNSESTIRSTLESVLAQSYADYELIIVDGASSDGTMEVVREFEPRFGDKLRYISEPDSGIYDGMNKGIAMASGDVIGFLNSDDYFTSNDILQKVANALICSDVDAVYGDVHYVRSTNLNRCVRYYSSKRFRPWKMLMGWMPAHPSFYCRREIYEKYGQFDANLSLAADFDLMLRLIYINNINTRYLPLDFVTMRMGGASSRGVDSHSVIIREHIYSFRKNGVCSNVLLDCMRYPFKLWEFVIGRFVH